MKRTIPIMVIVTAIGLLLLMYARSQTRVDSRAAARSVTIKRIQVNAQTIRALPGGKKYVVDLTQRGVVYEFDSKSGQIDFSRVMVRTARGDVAIGAFLETTFLKAELAGFKYSSQAFSVATRPAGTFQSRQARTSSFRCGDVVCTCVGGDDCDNMVYSTACDGKSFCAKNPITGQIVCSCPLGQRP